MDRASLEEFLARGLSLADIGRRLGRHEATVAYWIDKHGLQAVNRQKHAARGGLERAELERLVEQGASIAQIAEAVGRSKATVRHWLIRYGLKTHGARGRRIPEAARMAKQTAKRAGVATVTTHCQRHGQSEFWLTGRGNYRCNDVDRTLYHAGAVGSRRRWSERREDAAVFVATTATCALFTSITSIHRPSATRSTPRAWP